jgi:hypothetical protein
VIVQTSNEDGQLLSSGCQQTYDSVREINISTANVTRYAIFILTFAPVTFGDASITSSSDV